MRGREGKGDEREGKGRKRKGGEEVLPLLTPTLLYIFLPILNQFLIVSNYFLFSVLFSWLSPSGSTGKGDRVRESSGCSL